MTKRISRARAILQQHDALAQRRYDGSIDAIEELVDLATAIEKAGLTQKQAEVIRMRYVEGYETDQLVEYFGNARQVIQRTEKAAIAKIDAVYDRWEAFESRSPAQKRFDTLIAMKKTKEAV